MRLSQFTLSALLLAGFSLSLQAQTISVASTNDWNTGYRVEYDVENNGTVVTEGWLVVLQLPVGTSPASVSNAVQLPAFSNPSEGLFAFGNETYNGTISGGGSQTFGFNLDPDNDTSPPTTGQVTLNFDPGSQPSFQVADATILEGDTGTKTVTLTVSLNPAALDATTVNYTTVDGTATAGSDYIAAFGALNFAAGDTEKILTLTLLGDTIDEGNESFTLELSDAVGASITDSTATISITENDVVPDLAIADASTFENGGNPLQFTVTLTPPASSVVTVAYETGGGTATAGVDYVATSGILTFAPGDTSQSFSVDVLDDSLEEFPESFQVILSGQTNVDLGRSVANGNILDDERSGNGKPETGMFNYAEVLQKTMYFYEAQRSGDLPETNRVKWRADSALNDGSDVNRDLTGGWYDAGDHVKFGFPMAYSATVLAWGGIEFQEGYLETGQFPYLLENLRWACDYFLKCHEVDAAGKTTTFWGQVGNGGVDHAYWGSPELYPQARPSYKIDRVNPGTDLACETAAALAASSMIFRSTDPTYADTLLENARQLYEFGDTYRGVYSASITDAASFYNSFSGFEDELLWGALWLSVATGEQSYLNTATSLFNTRFPDGQNALGAKLNFGPSWDDKNYGNLILMAKLSPPTSEIFAKARDLFTEWITLWDEGGLNGTFTKTPGGLRWLLQWGSCRYAANTAVHALIYAKTIGDPDGSIQAFGESQINYILGDNPQGVSYVIGFGDDYPTHPHHRSAHGGWQNSGPEADANGDQFPSRNILYGGLVGGPITPEDDGWIPWRYKRDGSSEAFQANEVATDYNAGFTSAVARMYELYGGSPLADFPPEVTIPQGTEMFVSAAVTSNEARFTQVRCLVNNRSYAPAREGKNLAFRYYLNLSELYAAGLTKDDVEISFNPISNGGGGGAAPTISALLPHDEEERIYYAEIDLGGQNPLPIGRSPSQVEVQVRFGVPNSAPANAWNPDNDFSFSNISSGASNTSYSGFIPTYQLGQLIDGMVPDGDGVVTTPAFEIWQEATFSPGEASGPMDDPDGDGHVNIVEYAFGLDPKSPDSQVIITMTYDLSAQKAVAEFPVNPNASDALIMIMGSPDLGLTPWREIQTAELPRSNSTMKAVEADIPAGADRYFFRTRVELSGN